MALNINDIVQRICRKDKSFRNSRLIDLDGLRAYIVFDHEKYLISQGPWRSGCRKFHKVLLRLIFFPLEEISSKAILRAYIVLIMKNTQFYLTIKPHPLDYIEQLISGPVFQIQKENGCVYHRSIQ